MTGSKRASTEVMGLPYDFMLILPVKSLLKMSTLLIAIRLNCLVCHVYSIFVFTALL